MKYDFTSIIDRRGKDAIAVDGIGGYHWGTEPDAPREGFDAIPMWVADMNFPTVPTIPEALIERAKHPLYGYFEMHGRVLRLHHPLAGDAQRRNRPASKSISAMKTACSAAWSAR